MKRVNFLLIIVFYAVEVVKLLIVGIGELFNKGYDWHDDE